MMTDFLRNRSPSLSWVVLVLLVIVFLQGSISYSTTFGVLSRFIPVTEDSPAAGVWLGLRFVLITVVLLLWLLIYHQLCVQPDRHAASDPPRQDADAVAVNHLDHHPDRHRGQRDRAAGGQQMNNL